MSSKVFISGAADFYPPPYSFEDATTVTFFVEPNSNEVQKLRDICEEFLNGPVGHPARFELSLERVAVTFSNFPDVEADNSALGFLSYQEVSLIILVRDTQENEVGMFAPILFLDGPQTGDAEYFASWPIALGREVFGLAKTRGDIDFRINNFTGQLKALYPSALNEPFELRPVVKVSFPLEVEKTGLVVEMIGYRGANLGEAKRCSASAKEEGSVGNAETAKLSYERFGAGRWWGSRTTRSSSWRESGAPRSPRNH